MFQCTRLNKLMEQGNVLRRNLLFPIGSIFSEVVEQVRTTPKPCTRLQKPKLVSLDESFLNDHDRFQ